MSKRKWMVTVLLGCAVLAYLAGRTVARDGDPAAGTSDAVAVAVTRVQQGSWQPFLEATGSLRAWRGVSVTAQESGMVTAIRFESGRQVSGGDVLVQQYDADQQFKLKSLQAEMELARKSYQRSQSLMGSKAESQSQLDTALSELERLSAEVESLQESIAKRAIRAPFDGILGIRRVNLGQYIEPGDEIVTLQALDPVYVDFSLPQNELAQVQLGQEVRITVDAYPGLEFSGKVDAIEPMIDAATRSFQLEAVVANPALQLRPGMFVATRVLLPMAENRLTVPQAAINYNPYGDSVFLVEDGLDGSGRPALVVKSVFVTLGEARGDQVAVESGLQAGDRVVVAGQLRLRNGSAVVVDDSVEVGNDPDPGVANS